MSFKTLKWTLVITDNIFILIILCPNIYQSFREPYLKFWNVRSYLHTWEYYSLASPTAQWNIFSSVNHLINEKLNSKFSEVFEGLKFMHKISEHMKQLRILWIDSRGSKMEH